MVHQIFILSGRTQTHCHHQPQISKYLELFGVNLRVDVQPALLYINIYLLCLYGQKVIAGAVTGSRVGWPSLAKGRVLTSTLTPLDWNLARLGRNISLRNKTCATVRSVLRTPGVSTAHKETHNENYLGQLVEANSPAHRDIPDCDSINNKNNFRYNIVNG